MFRGDIVNDFSLMEKLKILMNIIGSSPLFLFCSMLSIVILIFFIINIKKDKKINKWIFIGLWGILLIVLVIKYNDIVIKLIDDLFDYIFKLLYFPDLPIYVIILIISNIFFIFSIFSKKIENSYKMLNTITSIILDSILVLIIDIVSKNNIDIYNSINIYSNSSLLVLLELSVGIFVSWLLINLLITANYKLKKYNKVEYPKMQEIIFEDI